MWYTSLAIQRLHIEPFEHETNDDGTITKSENQLFNMYYYSIMFIVLLSIVLHGITVPIAHMTLTYTTRSFHKKDTEAAWPTDIPIDGNAISGPITKIDNDSVLKKKDEDADITDQTDKVANITPIKENGNDRENDDENDVQIDINDGAEGDDNNYQVRESEVNLVSSKNDD